MLIEQKTCKATAFSLLFSTEWDLPAKKKRKISEQRLQRNKLKKTKTNRSHNLSQETVCDDRMFTISYKGLVTRPFS